MRKQMPFSLKNLFFYFLKQGTFGFGGAIHLSHIIYKDLVEDNKWISDKEFKQGLAFMQFSPGPLITQLSMYIGFLKRNVLGATIAGIGFLAPSFVMVLIISVLYEHFGSLQWMRGTLYGIGAVVIGIITSAIFVLAKKTMKRRIALWSIAVAIFFITAFTGKANFLLFIVAGLITFIIYTKKLPRLFALNIFPLAAIQPIFNNQVLFKVFIFFFSAGSLAFGGGFAILPYLQLGVVNQYHWLTNKQFVDAVAVAMITPGPVVMTSVFIGYIVAGLLGAIIAAIGIFLPVYLIVLFFTQFFRKHADHPHLMNFIEGVIAAAIGAMAGSVIILAKESVVDMFTALLAIAAFIGIRFFRIPAILIIFIGGILGVFFYH